MNWLLIGAIAACLVTNVAWCVYATSLEAKLRKLEDRNIELYETLRFHKAFIPVQREEVKTVESPR